MTKRTAGCPYLESPEKFRYLLIQRNIAKRAFALTGEMFAHLNAYQPLFEVECIPLQQINLASPQPSQSSQQEDLEALAPFIGVQLAVGASLTNALCGIRPDELTKMTWDDVFLDEKTVVIRENVSKTKRRRFVDISENCVAWLNLCNRSGKIVPYTAISLRRARRKKLAGSIRSALGFSSDEVYLLFQLVGHARGHQSSSPAVWT
jgi:integrase